MFDITVTIIFHREGAFALPALSSMAELVSSARGAGMQVEARAVLDNADDLTRRLVVSRGAWLDGVEEVSFGDLGLSRNQGVQSARGEFLAFLDGDDLWGSDWLRLAYAAATAPDAQPNTVWHPESLYFFNASDSDRQSISGQPHYDVQSLYLNHHPSTDSDLFINTLLLENIWSANVFARRSLHLQHPYRSVDKKTGIGIEDWSWNIETVWADIPHRVVPDTVHILRVKEAGSLNQNNVAEGLLPYLPDHVWPRFSSREIRGINRMNHYHSLTVAVTERDEQIGSLNQAVVERDEQITSLNQAVAERDEQNGSLSEAVAERDEQIAGLNQAVAERDEQIGSLSEAVAERDEQIANLNQTVHEKDVHISNLTHAVTEFQTSTSWHLTKPVRFVGRQVLRTKIVIKALPFALSMCSGYRGLIKHTWRTYKHEGISGIKRRILFSASPGAQPPVIEHEQPGQITDSVPRHNDYDEWVRRYDTLTDHDREKIRERIEDFHKKPLISVVMPVYNPSLNMLEDAIRSVQDQLYPYWELCIADDASTDAGVHELLQRYAESDSRIKVVYREENGHISAATNSALELVTGEYLALLDNDDLLRETALFWVADTINANPDAGLVYSDEDKIDKSGRRYDPYFKSDWNPDLFHSHNMICHLGVYRTDLVRKLGGFREGYEGAQDYDLALRFTEQLDASKIVHIPRVLYHWRSHPGSTAQAGSEKNYALLAGQRALSDHFSRTGDSAKVELLDFGMYRARYAIPAPAPMVSLIIPTRNGLSLIKQCIDSILTKTTYKNYEVLIVDNNSDDPEALAYFASIAEDDRIRVLRDERPFNYSALNNAAVKQARGEYIALVNNDIEVISPEWLDEMMSLAIQPGVGAVGARLWYPNDTLQHGGVITGIGGVAGHSHKHLPRDHFGYFARAQLMQTMSVVTAACLVVKKHVYQEVDGLDEENLKVAFNDVDFCLRVREAGYRNVWTPYAELYHHESATRGYEDNPEKQARFRDEVLYMKKRWEGQLRNDPAYSPNLTLDYEDFSYAWPPRLVRL